MPVLALQESGAAYILQGLLIFLAVIVVVPATLLFLLWFHSPSEEEPRTEGDGIVLEHTVRTKVVAWAAMLGFGSGFIAVMFGGLEGNSYWMSVSITSALLLLATLAVMETRSRALVNDEGILDYKVWRGHRTVRWDDVTSVVPSLGGYVAIKDRNGVVVRLSDELKGLRSLVGFFERHLETSTHSRVSRMLDK